MLVFECVLFSSFDTGWPHTHLFAPLVVCTVFAFDEKFNSNVYFNHMKQPNCAQRLSFCDVDFEFSRFKHGIFVVLINEEKDVGMLSTPFSNTNELHWRPSFLILNHKLFKHKNNEETKITHQTHRFFARIFALTETCRFQFTPFTAHFCNSPSVNFWLLHTVEDTLISNYRMFLLLYGSM